MLNLKQLVATFPFASQVSTFSLQKTYGLARTLLLDKTKVKKLDIEKYANKIDFNCCNHRSNRNKYFLGYTGLKCCKISMCLDCDKIQYVGGNFGKIIYPIVRKIVRNRLEILETIEIEPVFDEQWQNELEKYGRDKQ